MAYFQIRTALFRIILKKIMQMISAIKKLLILPNQLSLLSQGCLVYKEEWRD